MTNWHQFSANSWNKLLNPGNVFMYVSGNNVIAICVTVCMVYGI